MAENDGLLKYDPATDDALSSLQFRDFDASGAASLDGRISTQKNTTPFRDVEAGGGGGATSSSVFQSVALGGSTSNSSQSAAAAASAAAPAAGGPTLNPLSINYYRPWFDIDTDDIVSRLRRSVIPSQEKFLEGDQSQADLYGPFWICTTLIFLMAAAGNLGSFLSFATSSPAESGDAIVPGSTSHAWNYNFSKLTVASGVLYAYLGFVPLAGWLVSRYMLATPFKLIEMICLYGYSFTIYLPVAVVCVMPSEIVRWAALCAAFALSSLFILRNIRETVMEGTADPQRGFLLLAVVLFVHFSLTLFLKFYFYA